MALQVCAECSTAYAPAAACPHCGSGDWLTELEADKASKQKTPKAKDDKKPDEKQATSK